MFDGLKDKLNSFRESVEETAEEKAEEAESEAPDAPDAAADAEADADADAEADAAADAEADADGAGAEASESGPEPVDGEPAPSVEPESVDEGASVEDDGDASEAESGALADAPGAEALAESETKRRSGVLKQAKAFATGKVIIEEEDLEEPLWELEMALLESDVEMNVAEAILDTIREKMVGESRAQVQTTAGLVEEALHDALYDVVSVGQFDFDERVASADKPVVIVFTGVNGVGKTTTIAKLSEYLADRGYSSVLANGDTYRAGANEQIREHADRLGRRLIAHDQGGDPAAVIYDGVEYAEANDVDVVLGDTAGRLHTSNDLMAQLEKIDRVVDPDLTLFVDEAVAGQDAVQRAKQFNEAAAVDGAVLTKADADSSGGAAISIAYVTGKPVLFLGTGQGYDDLERFDPERLVDRLLGREAE
jgi:fused signal recognition particle receptor